MKAVCLWSGPRNVSTALMYSFAQRPDTRVIDEPLYGHFLRVTGTVHPGRDEVMANVDCDGDAVMRSLLKESSGDPDVLFMKQMAHHLVEVDKRFLQKSENIFLIRDPEQMLPSLTIQLPAAALFDTGLRMQWELYEELVDAGQSPAIVDSRELLLNPAGVLTRLCDHMGIPFFKEMLSWPAGPRDEDGIWAPHWYHAVHKSTGFAAYRHKSGFPDKLKPLLDECAPWYDKLFAHAIRAEQTNQQGASN
ncbi:MAG: sulfotransferase family protein [Gammaproteobacteria bacterium]|nr:sulfotransferase family protein [Gammaproteobacteria bacterium]